MHRNIIKKSLGLLLLYVVIIVGIFYVQFRSDSVISERIGVLRITLSQTKTDNGSIALENKLRVSYNGISIVVDDEHPASVLPSGENRWKNLTLISWRKPNALSCEFVFTDDVALRFTLSDETESARLSIQAFLPDNVSDFQIPYELLQGAEIATQTGNRLQLAMHTGQWELIAASVEDSHIAFNAYMDRASYASFDTTRRFTFENAASFAASDASVYESTIAAFKQNLISAFNAQVATFGAAGIAEQDAVSFVAAMSEFGRYNDAISAVPAAFRQGAQRTYLSAPYFDSLVAILPSLERQMTNFREIVAQGSLDAFAVPRIADYLCINPNSAAVRSLLENAASAEIFMVRQAANVLAVYVELLEKNTGLAEYISPAVQKCVETIAAACNTDGALITISENGVFLSVIDGVTTGDALLRYGRAVRLPALEASGRLIIDSYLAESGSFDLHTLAEIYPLIVHDNPYYPHVALLGFDNGNTIWAWTCATDITFARNATGASTFTIDFPQGYTHYVIIEGIRPFNTVYIYNMAYRTDPRFEVYNSSGYVYRENTNTLLLKSLHRERLETVRLMYAPAVQETTENRTVNESGSTGGETAPPVPTMEATQGNPDFSLAF